MAKKKETEIKRAVTAADLNAEIIDEGLVIDQPITQTLEINYMPYAMSVIVSRAIPEIDGFKPSHRKLLYSMYLSGLLGDTRRKSAAIVGDAMKLNPHGDAAIYETMVRMTRGNETLLHPYIDSKGNFGKAYSRDMAYAASRYTEAKLEKIANELFSDISKDAVDFVDNFDATIKEPTLLPVTFPSILVNSNTGIAVGMASNICSFNLKEVCETTIALIRDKNHNISDTLIAPDFPGGGLLVYDKAALDSIYETGRGGFKVRSVYTYDKKANCIDITQIPFSTTLEVIIEKVIELMKAKKIQEINDIRDETGLDGLKITIDLKRGADPEKLMNKLFKMTPLEDTFSCNFNILVGGYPKVMGIREILEEWIAFRSECVRRKVYFTLSKAKDKLHLLKGLEKILLDIDKAVKIVRETELESDVVPNLMIGFGIDEIQANYVAEIKLRHLNREYILNRTKDIEVLQSQIAELESILASNAKVRGVIVSELKEVIRKYSQPRKTQIYYPSADDEEEIVEEIPDYPVTVFFTREGYFKKITPQSLRMSGEQKLKEGDEIISTVETTNGRELLFFTDKCQVYKAKVNDFSDTKASSLGEFVASKLKMEEGENTVQMVVTDSDYKGNMLFFYENGKVAKVEMQSYATKTNRKKLINAYCEKSPLIRALYAPEDAEFIIKSSAGRILLIHSGVLNSKSTKSTQGVAVMTLKKSHRVVSAEFYTEGTLLKPHRYRARNLPASGALQLPDELGEQLTL
ncbi:MAG: DNA gyrase subunit A [Acutalibacteraceae bacterium]